MEDKRIRGHFEEFGVESVPPDDEFAHWVARKRREHEKERIASTVQNGVENYLNS